MTNTQLTALQLAQQFMNAFAGRNPEAAAALLAEDATLTIALGIDGSPTPWYFFDGQTQVRGYIEAVAAKFDRVAFLDQEWHASMDGRTAFMEARGDILSSAEGLEYRNVYVFKIEVSDGLVARVTEYANPVTYANLGIKDSETEAAAR
ncbi:MAG: nuclear transport factor 2 family protein [Cellulomonas sp.]|uniref:nuclear transport factor 2 family protein n=1 Tax=Cellulomonas sp. TaxID=40001 RepID=UPI0019E21F19|nr:nuclear transport factor 2 family protein [Cellulomonas sp.]MBF0688615.1 nuclear transport factor 2 family protein [Cellulomonas sp.]